MAHYSIYIPGTPAPNAQSLAAVGLDGLVREGDQGPSWYGVLQEGPDGGCGQIVTWVDPRRGKDNPAIGYQPGRQKWESAPPDAVKGLPASRYWFGFEPERPPTPQDLARLTMLPGFHPTLADGQEWVMPNIRRLPHRIGLGRDGQETQIVKDQFQALAERMRWAFDQAEIYLRYERANPAEFREYIAFVLGFNYRVNLSICYWLQLFDESNWWSVSNASIDFQALIQIEEDLKKNDAASSPST